jgi:hypothetical protein
MTQQSYTDSQRILIAVANLTKTVESFNDVIYSRGSAPPTPTPGLHPLDLHLNALNQHLVYAMAQYAAMQDDAAGRVLDDQQAIIDDLNDELNEGYKDMADSIFGARSHTDIWYDPAEVERFFRSVFSGPEPSPVAEPDTGSSSDQPEPVVPDATPTAEPIRPPAEAND